MATHTPWSAAIRRARSRWASASDTKRILGQSGSVEVTIQLPAGSHVEAKAAAAEFRGVGRLGDIAVDGDVEVGRLTGPAQISTQRGDIRITEALRGTVTRSTTASADRVVWASWAVSWTRAR
ncbi:hypothetical protein [Streptomyces sp. NRRL S-813]|uniref:hypothetical protein n=1 Tax=Streptomyces sp. NRRL S-813 TaxID=1463919 RepID=UPI003B63458C